MLKDEEGSPKEPLISSANWALLETNVGLLVMSAKSVEIFAISVAIEEETLWNAPDISVAICAELESKVFPSKVSNLVSVEDV